MSIDLLNLYYRWFDKARRKYSESSFKRIKYEIEAFINYVLSKNIQLTKSNVSNVVEQYLIDRFGTLEGNTPYSVYKYLKWFFRDMLGIELSLDVKPKIITDFVLVTEDDVVTVVDNTLRASDKWPNYEDRLKRAVVILLIWTLGLKSNEFEKLLRKNVLPDLRIEFEELIYEIENQYLKSVFEEYIKFYDTNYLPNLGMYGPLIPSRRGFTYTPSTIFRIVRESFEKFLQIHVTPTDLRHSRAIHLLKKGYSINDVARYLRVSEDTTQTIVKYLKVLKELKKYGF